MRNDQNVIKKVFSVLKKNILLQPIRSRWVILSISLLFFRFENIKYKISS